MWFTENAWPPIFIGIACIVLLLSAWTRTGKNWCAVLATGLAVACVGIYIFERLYVTERESAEAEVPKLIAAVEADDVDRVLSFIDKDATRWREAVKAGMSQYRIDDPVRLTDVHSRYAANGADVITHFRANGMGVRKSDSASHHIPTRWELTWKKTAAGWKIIHIQRLHPTTDEKMDLLDRP